MALAINCDMGEGFGLYRCGDDAAIMPFITLANVACGFHASDPTVMHKTVRLAKQHGVRVGAHPSLPDLQGFGRREMRMDPKELADCLIYQVGALKAFLDAEGMALNHIKPHGALYGMAARSEEIANAVCDAADVFKVPLLGMARTKHEEVYTKRGFKFIPEFYVDLDYDKDGKLIITREHVAWDPEVAAKRTVRAITEKKVKTVDGNDIPMTADCICVHSDTPGAVAVAKAVKEAIKPYLN
jgi:5-oxoprolinase (ATP-hydrolysing) subunit A